jgi:ubiquinone/menaquinone biosynthesis C-methylase UbiE
MKFLPSLILFSLCHLSLPAETPVAPDQPAEAAKEAPPALKEYKGRLIAQTMHWTGADWLTRHEREREESAARMFKELNLKPGQVLCDLGSGNGYHTIPMAEAVLPGGKVYAVDIQPEMLTLLEKRAEKRAVTNIEYILGELWDPKIPENTMDMILVVDAYHEFSHPEHMLKAIHKALKPTGVLVMVEYRAEDDSVPIKTEHKMSKDQVSKELEPNGFKLVRSFDELPWQHMLFYQAIKE